MRKRVFVGALVSLLVVGGHSALADGPSKNTDNDVNLVSPGGFTEYFKRDSSGGRKNYIYTRTEFVDGHGRVCTVITGASESTLAIDCDFPPRA